MLFLALAGCDNDSSSGQQSPVTVTDPPPSTPSQPPPLAGGEDEPPGTVITGVAAVGAALDGATVTVFDATGLLLELGDVLTGSDGSYQVEVPANTPVPLLFVVTPPEGEPLRALVKEANPGEEVSANINPLTELVTNELVGDITEDPLEISEALAPVVADPESVDATGDAVVGALLGGDLSYESFANDPNFVADSEGDETPSVTDTLLDTLEQTADRSDQSLTEFLQEQLDAPEPPMLIEQPAFQVRYVGELISQGNEPAEIEQRLEDSGAITALDEGESTDVFRQAIVAVPALIEQTTAATTSLEDTPELQGRAVEAAVDALANLVEERSDRFGDSEDELEAALASDEVISTVTTVITDVVTPVLEEVAQRTDIDNVVDALDEVLESVSEGAGQTISAFEPEQLETTDVTALATAHLQQNVIAEDAASQLDAIAAGDATPEDVVQNAEDVTDTGSALQELLDNNATLVSGGDGGAVIETPPAAWNVSNWNEFEWL